MSKEECVFHIHCIYPGGKHGALNVLMSKVNGSEGPRKRFHLTPVSKGYRDQHGAFIPKEKILFPDQLKKREEERKRLSQVAGVAYER